MRTFGYVLIGIGFLCALLWSYLGRESVVIMAVGGLSIVAGNVLLAVNATTRMLRGELRLRPFDALKRGPIIFLVTLGVYGLAALIFPATQFKWTEAVLKCAIISIVMAFYVSAYRKPA